MDYRRWLRRMRGVSRFPRDLIAAALIICGLLIFLPNVTGYFLADDFVLLSWTQVHSAGEVLGFFDPATPWFYRPVVKVVYWVGQTVFGLRAAPFHLFSLLLHGANGYLLYRLVARMSGALWVSGLAAGLLFLLNAHHAETVSWVAAVGDLLALFCILSSLPLFRGYYDTRNPVYLAASVGLFSLGLFSRETTVMLPVVLVLYVLLIHGDGSQKAPLRLGHYVVIGVAYGLVLASYVLVQGTGASASAGRGGLQFHALNPDSILLGVMDYMHGLVPGGSYLAALSLDTLRWLVWVEAAALLFFAVALWWVRWRVVLFGFLWILITPLMFVFFSGPTDRYFYLPSVGYAIMIAALLTKLLGLLSRWRVRTIYSNSAVALAVMALLMAQVPDLVAKERAWKVAGQVSGGVFHDVRQAVPNPAKRSTFYFTDLPGFINGVPAFQNALPVAIQVMYGNQKLAAQAVTCDELRAAKLSGESYFFRFKGDGVKQMASVEECR